MAEEKEEVGEYQKWLIRAGLADRTIQEYLNALDRYIRVSGETIDQQGVNNFLTQSNSYIDRAMIRSLKEWQPEGLKEITLQRTKSKPRKLPEPFKGYEVKLLMEQINPEYKELIWLLAECGLRISEATNLKHEDIDYEEGSIRVKGKGDQERIVYPSPNLMDALRAIQARQGVFSGYVWNSHYYENKPIHTDTIRKNMKKVLPHAHPHKFRHTFATAVYDATDDILAVKDLLGHKNIQTTSIYAHVSNKRAKEAANKVWIENEN